MAHPLYIFHCEAPLAEPLTCGRLAREIANRYTERRRPPDGSGAESSGAESSGAESSGAESSGAESSGAESSGAEVANLDDVELWGSAARLQWAMTSDRIITAQTTVALLAGLSAGGELDLVRRAVCTLTAALATTYPALACIDRQDLVQLVALGRGMATAVGESPDLFEFVKKELQVVDLAALLWDEPNN